MDTLAATVENMRTHGGSAVFAYSPITGERYSATPGDYFWLRDEDVLTDSEGEPMVLSVERRWIEPVR